jgi:type IV pilus assembly protein PilC
VVEDLRKRGVQVSELSTPRARRLFEPRGVRLDEFAFFNKELAGAVKRGVPLPGTIRALSHDLRGAPVREALAAVARDLEEGTDLADALAKHDRIFPLGYVALVSAGLKSGDLAGTLLAFAHEARVAARLRRKILGVVFYPLAIIFVGSLILSAYGWAVLPTFEEMFNEMGIRLPGLTRLQLALAPVWRYSPLALLALMILLPVILSAASWSNVGARLIAGVKHSLPVIGGLFKAVALGRFARAMASATRGGIPVPEALTLAGLASGSPLLSDAAQILRTKIEGGTRLSDAMTTVRLRFPATFIWMVHIAEERGEMAEALEEYATLQDEHAERVATLIPEMTQSALILIAGLLLGQIVIGMFLPLISLMEMMSG